MTDDKSFSKRAAETLKALEKAFTDVDDRLEADLAAVDRAECVAGALCGGLLGPERARVCSCARRCAACSVTVWVRALWCWPAV